jgi:hypothetical protein
MPVYSFVILISNCLASNNFGKRRRDEVIIYINDDVSIDVYVLMSSILKINQLQQSHQLVHM